MHAHLGQRRQLAPSWSEWVGRFLCNLCTMPQRHLATAAPLHHITTFRGPFSSWFISAHYSHLGLTRRLLAMLDANGSGSGSASESGCGDSPFDAFRRVTVKPLS